MKKEFSSQNPNLFFHNLLSLLCMLVLVLSTCVFLYLFFYQDLKSAYQSFKINNLAPTPIYKTPEIVIPKIDDHPIVQSQMPSQEQQLIQQVQPEHDEDLSTKAAEKIFIAYELGDTVLSSRLIADFLSEYPMSEYRHKVRLIGAKLMNERGDFTGSLNYIQKILGEKDLSNEDYSEAVLLLGSIARERKQYDSYIQSFLEQAYFRAVEPTKSQLAFYLGYLLLNKGDFQAALSYFNNVIGEDGVLGRADLYAAQTMRPETINALENFITQYPSSKNYSYARNTFIKESLLQAETLVSRGYLDSAMRYYKKIIKYFSKNRDGDQARLELAKLQYQKQDYSFAMTTLKEILDNEDHYVDPDALFTLGKIAFELNRQEEALGYFRALVEKYPTSPYISKAQEWQQLIFESLRN